MNVCGHNYCYYNKASRLTPSEMSLIENIPCGFCRTIFYCSSRCQEAHWLFEHNEKCQRQVSSTTQVVSLQQFGELDLIGKGSFGSVRRVVDKYTQQIYAMKTVGSINSLINEIKIHRELDHPHIIKLHHYFEDDSELNLILDFAEGGSLQKRLGQIKSEQSAFIVFFQLCLGIEYLHNRKIIHRDIKPDNILIDNMNDVRLCDFGLSQMDCSSVSSFSGTVEYMAPEIIRNLNQTTAVDVWSVGVVLFQMIQGELPVKGGNKSEILQCILQFERPLFNMNPISDDAKDLLERMLNPNPMCRITLREIFEHEWIVRMSKFYQIQNISLQNDEIISQTTSSTYQGPSRTSLHQKQLIKENKQEQKNSSIMDVFSGFFGCFRRVKQ